MNNFEIKTVSEKQMKSRKLSFHVGHNDAPYQVAYKDKETGEQFVCPYYRRWTNMMERAYGSNVHDREPTYVGCSVANEWHSFMAFKAWMEKQDWEDKVLDKDILIPGNRQYGPDTCLFVTDEVSALFRAKPITTKPIYRKSMGTYAVYINKYGKRINLGHHQTEADAINAYNKSKADYIRQIASNQECEVIRNCVNDLAERYEMGEV